MRGFSWATRRWGDENEYADWDRVLDELAERGYDCVRIDAFPHVMDAGEAISLPQRPRFMWGNRRAVRTPDDFARVWARTLAMVEEAGLLDTVRWVDLCNEFPLDPWAPGAADAIFGSSVASPFAAATRGLPWTQEAADRAQTYLTRSIRLLKARWPSLAYCFSLHEIAAASMRALDVSEFGVAEVHCWISDEAGLENEWEWVRTFAGLAVEKAIALGWTGICTSNFCQPHFPGMWADRGWHHAMTDAIRRA